MPADQLHIEQDRDHEIRERIRFPRDLRQAISDAVKPGEQPTVETVRSVLAARREFRPVMAELAPETGGALVRGILRDEVRTRIASGGLPEFVRGGYGGGG